MSDRQVTAPPAPPPPVVLDTNVFVGAGFNRDSASAAILEDVRAGRLRLVWDDATRREIEAVVARIPPLRGLDVRAIFREADRFVARTEPQRFGRVPDPADRKFAALAHAAGAVLVTSDDHLLSADVTGLRVVTPGEFRSRAGGTRRPLRISEGGLDDPRVLALLRAHLERARAETAPGSAHALDLTDLRAPAVSFWSVWQGEGDTAEVVAVGALRTLAPGHGEVKSMHTAESVRGQGIGSALLRHILAAARARGLVRLSLETGSWPYFAPARALYERHGFVECPPFGDYGPDPNSVFMSIELG